MSTVALQKYQVCVTTTGPLGSVALYDIEGWLSKGGKLIPIYDGGKTYQDESPYATVTVIEDTTPPSPKNTITFDELAEMDAAYLRRPMDGEPWASGVCPETVHAEGQSNVLVCRRFNGHDGDCEWVTL